MKAYSIKTPLLAAALAGLSTAATAAESDKPLLRDFMGINAHTVQFMPELYAPVCRLVRDYHPLTWDVDGDTSAETVFPKTRQSIGWKDKSGKFRDWSGPVDWNEIYSSWKAEGFEIDACIQFGNLTLDKWANPAEDAYRYGKAFAEYFGPSGPNKLVTSVEIGNEPAGRNRYPAADYLTIFEPMARGIREGDPQLKILTCTAAAPEPDPYSHNLNIFRELGDLYDVINIHHYTMLEGWPTWERTYPEDTEVGYGSVIDKAVRWRDQYAPDKEIWITEFGYDASTQKPDPEGGMKGWIDSTDLQQAQWIVRSFLCLSAMDVERAYLYWFNDGDTPSFHASSGITRFLEPKKSYWAMRHLYQSLGDYRFNRAVRQDEGELFVYEYVHGENPDQVVWVVWSPTGIDKSSTQELELPGKLVKAERMPTAAQDRVVVELTPSADGVVAAPVTESPLYLWVEK